MKTDIKPVRIQRSRRKGSKLESPNGLPVVCVTRPSEWGNPFKVGDWVSFPKMSPDGNGITYFKTNKENATAEFQEIKNTSDAVRAFETYMGRSVRRKKLSELRGINLACWCKIGAPCHADVLLKLANPELP